MRLKMRIEGYAFNSTYVYRFAHANFTSSFMQKFALAAIEQRTHFLKHTLNPSRTYYVKGVS